MSNSNGTPSYGKVNSCLTRDAWLQLMCDREGEA